MKSVDWDGYRVIYQKVLYGTPSFETSKNLLIDKSCNNLFLKDSFFKRQNEFRVVVCRNIEEIEEYNSKREDGKPMYENNRTATFYVPSSFKSARLYEMDSVERRDNKYLIPIST